MEDEGRGADFELGTSLYGGYYQRPEMPPGSTCKVCGGLLTKRKRRDFLPLGLVIVCVTTAMFFVLFPLIHFASVVILIYTVPGVIPLVMSPTATKSSCDQCKMRRK